MPVPVLTIVPDDRAFPTVVPYEGAITIPVVLPLLSVCNVNPFWAVVSHEYTTENE